jgi:dipeptidyl aminopeptidase/acylaminoacyl peptidase
MKRSPRRVLSAWLGGVLALCAGAANGAPPAPIPKRPPPYVRPAGAKLSLVKAAAPRVERRGALTLEGIPALPERIRERMNRYLNVRHAVFADFEEKGSGILALTRFGDTMQVHRVERPLGAREQLTFEREPIAECASAPGSERSLVIRMDQGGAERYQLHRLDLERGQRTLLSDGKSQVNAFRLSRRGALAYSSTARNGRDFDLYLMPSLKPGSARRVLEVRGQWQPLDFSPDEKRLLLLEYLSVNESVVHLLDLASGKAEALTPRASGSPPVANPAALFTPDGKGVYLLSDRRGELVELFHLDLATRKLTPLSGKLRWNVEELALAPDGRTLAFTLNEDGFSRLHLLDVRSRRVRRPEGIPAGVIEGLRFHRRRPLLGFTLMRASAPADAWTLDVDRGKVERWTRSEVGGLAPARFVTPSLIRYPTFDRDAEGKPRSIPAFYFRPPGKGPHPVLIEIHGGPEGQWRPYFSSLLQYLAVELGVAVLAPNVRGSDGYGKSYLLLDNGRKREDSVKDIGALLDWVARQPELDAKRVMVHGGSYGGYMVLASLIHYGKRLRAGVDWVGISSFVTFLTNTEAYRRDLRRAEYGDERDPAMRRFLQAISPLTRAHEIVSPLFVIQGANDPRVPASESSQLVRAVRGSGSPVWFLLADNEGHGFRKKVNRDLAMMLTVLFTETHLVPPPTPTP